MRSMSAIGDVCVLKARCTPGRIEFNMLAMKRVGELSVETIYGSVQSRETFGERFCLSVQEAACFANKWLVGYRQQIIKNLRWMNNWKYCGEKPGSDKLLYIDVFPGWICASLVEVWEYDDNQVRLGNNRRKRPGMLCRRELNDCRYCKSIRESKLFVAKCIDRYRARVAEELEVLKACLKKERCLSFGYRVEKNRKCVKKMYAWRRYK